MIIFSYVCLVLEDVFVLNNKDKKNPEIFGLFSTTRLVKKWHLQAITPFSHQKTNEKSLCSPVFKGYAVCVYNMDDIRAAFNGQFASRESAEHHWTPYEDRVPYPRPGSVSLEF